jgi:hypothetical protein
MSYFGNHLGNYSGKWWGYTFGIVVRRYILRIESHVTKTVMLVSRLF